MSNWICFFFISISFSITFIISALTETLINFPSPSISSFKGLFARKISSNKVYVSNLQEEMIYNLESNSMEKKISTPSTCSIGTQCPYLFMNGEEPTYILSKNGKVVTSIDIAHNTSITKTLNKQVRSVTFYDNSNGLILDGDGGILWGYVYLNKVNLATGGSTEITKWDYVDDASAFYSSKYSIYFFVSFNDGSGKISIGYHDGNDIHWEKYTMGIGLSKNSFQMVELKEQRLVICSINEGSTMVRCFSGVYSDPSLSFPFTLRQTITDIISGNDEHFSMYKLNDEDVIIGFSKNPMKIQRINSNLELIGGCLQIGSNNEYMDFTMLTETKLFAMMAKKNVDASFSFYYTILYYPHCYSSNIMLKRMDTFQIIKLFTDSKAPELTSSTIQIMILTNPVNGGIYKVSDDQLAEVNVVYSTDALYYKATSSSNDLFTYKGIDNVSQPPQEWASEICTLNLVICYESCNKCTVKGDETSHNCVECDSLKGYFPAENFVNNCYNTTTKPTNYYFDSSDSTFKKCYDSCKTCSIGGDSEEHHCDSCDIDGGYYPIEDHVGNCIINTTFISGYTVYMQKYYKCYDTCLECTMPLIGENQYCNGCKEGYMPSPLITTNCVQNCPSGKKWYIGQGNAFNCVEGDECPGQFPLLADGTQCVASCSDFFTCPFCIQNQPLYEYNDECVTECPNGILIGIKCNQLLPEQSKPEITDSAVKYESDASREGFVDIKDQAIQLGISSTTDNNTMTIIKGEDYSFNLYPSGVNPNVTKENNSPRVDLGECEDLLRVAYSIPEDEELYIGQMVYNTTLNTSGTNPIQYEVYNAQGVKLDLEPCNGVKVKVTQPLTNIANLNLDLAKQLAEEGIDIYDAESSIFNDICTTFTLNGKDVSMSDRREQVFTNATFCSDGCTLSKLNYDTNEAECDCDTSSSSSSSGISELLQENEMFSMFSTLLSSTNLEMFICAKLILNPKNLVNNVGHWLMASSFSILTSMTVIFYVSHMQKLFSFLNTRLGSSPSSPHVIPIVIDHFDIDSVDLDSDKHIVDASKDDQTGMYSDRVQFNNYIVETKVEKKINIPKQIENKYQLSCDDTNEDSTSVAFEEMDTEELNELSFEEACKKDIRGFCKYYFDIICEKQIILSTILSKSIFYPLSARVIMLFFSMSSFFFLNAMFFTEEYISERYNSGESLDIIYILKNEISKSVYSSMIGMLIGKVLSLVASSGTSFTKLFRCKTDWNYYVKFKNLVKDIKRKYIILLVIIFVMTMIYWYFLFIFCTVYKNNQLSWVQSSLISIFINILIPLVICLIVAVIRAIAFKCNNSLLFKISHCIYQIL